MRKTYLPLKAFVAYIVFTIFVAFFGPIIYEGMNEPRVGAYMAAFLVLFAIGYSWGVKGGRKERTRNPETVERASLPVVKAAVVVTVLYKLYELVVLVRDGKLNFSFEAIGLSYFRLYEGYVRGEGGYELGYVISLFFYLPLLIGLILGIYYFKRLPLAYRIGVLAIIGLILVVNTLGQGKQKQLGDILVFMLSVLAVRVGVRANAGIKTPKRKVYRLYVAAIIVLALGIGGFVNILASRYQALGIDARTIATAAHPMSRYDMDHPVVRALGPDLGFAAAAFSSYLSQGYLGLSLAMDEPFVWTYGVGNSYAMTILAGKLLNLPIALDNAYPFRVGESRGWTLAKWHSAFSWFASDFTFPGVLILFLFYAVLYGRCWREAVLFQNPVSILLFCILNLGLVFVHANNQLLHTPESVLAVVAILIAWLRFHRRLNVAPNSLSGPLRRGTRRLKRYVRNVPESKSGAPIV